jgi:hypothetical protein
MIIVGIDPCSRSHTAATIDEQGRLLDGLEVGAGPGGLEKLCGWIAALPEPRLVAMRMRAATDSRSSVS